MIWYLPYGSVKSRKTTDWRPSDESCAISHCLKWGTLPLNEVGMITQRVGKRQGTEEGNDKESRTSNLLTKRNTSKLAR